MTEERKKLLIIDDYNNKEDSDCPSCKRATLEVTKSDNSGEWILFVSCPRCDFKFEWTKEEDKIARKREKERKLPPLPKKIKRRYY